MPAAKKVLRGVQNIRTMSGRVDDQAIPYKAYMKISVLEMEKHRRGVERACALEKVRRIDQRFQEIEAEKQKALKSLEGGQPVAQSCGRRPVRRSAAAPLASTGSFKIRY
ncbi:MAG: hypothetical protein WCL16_13685 [bacterium]